MGFFRGEREALRFTEIVYGPAIPGVERFLPSKSNSRASAIAAGVRVPAQYATFEGPDAVDFDKLPDRFVLKADNMASMRGVYLLQRRGGAYYEHFSRRMRTKDWVLDNLRTTLRERGKSERSLVHAEEFIVGENGPDEIPYDYKMYTFDGEVEYILQVNRNTQPDQGAFFRRGFAPMEEHLISRRSLGKGQPVRPRNWEEMLDAAKRIAVSLDVPFIRVDLYTTGAEAVLGELTPRPGGPYYGGQLRFSTEFDVELGTYWRMALRRRGASAPIVTGLPPVLEKIERQQDASRAAPPGIAESLKLLARAVRNWLHSIVSPTKDKQGRKSAKGKKSVRSRAV